MRHFPKSLGQRLGPGCLRMVEDHAAVKAEIENDPAGLGYAQAGYAQAIADRMNAVGAGLVKVEFMDQGDFALAMLDAMFFLDLDSAQIPRAWADLFCAVSSMPVIDLEDRLVRQLLDEAVADGLMSPEKRASIGVRLGSRAEVLFGAGVRVTAANVAAACAALSSLQ